MFSDWVKYAILAIVSILICCGIYYTGYISGKNNAKLKVVTEQVEVIKYVEKEKAHIYSQPNISRDSALQLFNDNIL